jgi:hypothetical protein
LFARREQLAALWLEAAVQLRDELQRGGRQDRLEAGLDGAGDGDAFG